MYKNYVLLRDKKGVTDSQVSKDTGITKSTFSDWKAGRYTPKVEKLKKLADYFGVGLEYFLGDQQSNKTDRKERKNSVKGINGTERSKKDIDFQYQTHH